jgi:hypothetical protein
MKADLLNAGKTNQEAEAGATHWAQHSVVMANEKKIPIEEYFNSKRPDIVTEDRPYRASILKAMRSEIEQGKLEMGSLNQDQEGNVIGRTGYHSSFPEYFRNKGYQKKAVLGAIDKYIKGQALTDKQKETIHDLYNTSGYAQEVTSRKADAPMLQEKAVAPAFYSKLERLVQDKVANNSTPAQILATLKDVKAEELQYSGLKEFLTGKEKVSKQELLDFLKENQVEIDEIIKRQDEILKPLEWKKYNNTWSAQNGTTKDVYRVEELDNGKFLLRLSSGIEELYDNLDDAKAEANSVYNRNAKPENSTKFSQYVLPGGENYRELLFTFNPNDNLAAVHLDNKEAIAEYLSKKGYPSGDITRLVNQIEKNPVSYKSAVSDRGIQPLVENLAKSKIALREKINKTFHSSHWDESNVLLHTRLTDRTDSEGKKVLFVEEIQSDWHQDGRKNGYKQPKLEQRNFNSFMKERFPNMPDSEIQAEFKSEESENFKAWREEQDAARKNAVAVPDAPFKKTWHEYALKRILRMAAEQGYDRVAWTTGEQQAERYDLSKQIDAVKAVKHDNGLYTIAAYKDEGHLQRGRRDPLIERSGLDKNGVSDVIGKELAEKITNDLINPEEKIYSGVDLKVGGEGMKGFYDKILPDFVNKYVKKWGAKVGSSEVQTSKDLRDLTLSTDENGRYIILHDGNRLENAPTFPEISAARKYIENIAGKKDPVKVHSVDVTPAMRDSLLNEGQTLFQYAGQKAKSADTLGLSKALSMQESGLGSEQIRKETGWFKGKDEKWRFEIDDSGASLKVKEVSNRKNYTLGDILNHEQLFAAYPELRNIQIKFLAQQGNTVGTWYGGNNKIVVRLEKIWKSSLLTDDEVKEFKEIKETKEYKKFSESYFSVRGAFLRGALRDAFTKTEIGKKWQRLNFGYGIGKNTISKELGPDQFKTLLHEIQHAIQHLEGFSPGGNSKGIGYDAYRNLPGEVEARDSAERKDLTKEQRAEKEPAGIVKWGPVELQYKFEPSGQGSLFQADKSDIQGSISFTPTGDVISLFKESNPSTFMHETAHAWLKEMFEHVRENEATLSERYIKDWLVVSEWLNISPDQTALTTEQHEKFARGFEVYLYEGKAPSEGLRKVFRIVRRWLTRIYPDVKMLGVEISNEVRMVMDRMLATEEEIAAAQKAVGYEPLVANIEGLSPEVVAKIKDLQDRAHEEAVSVLLKKQMDELKTERRETIDQQRAKIEYEVKKELGEIPIYKLMNQVKEQLKSKKTAKTLSQEYLDGKLKNAAEFEGIAELNGYSSGGEMAHAFLSVAPMEKEFAAAVQARMAEFADLKDTAKIKTEAMQVIHSEKSLELMALEREALADLINKTQVNEEAKIRRAKRAKIEAEAAKLKAREILTGKTIKEATAFLPYFTAERNAAVQVSKAIAKKDYEKASEYKRKQMLNHALATEALRISRSVDKWLNYLKDAQTKKKELFKREEHFHQVGEILSRLGFPRRDYDSKLKTMSLGQWAETMSATTNTVSLPDWVLDESQIKNYKELSVSSLQDVVNAIKNITSVANFENRAFTIVNGATIEQIATDLTKSLDLNTPEKDKYKPTMEPGKFDGIKKFAAKYLLSITKIQSLIFRGDGYKENGKFAEAFKDPIYRAANEESKLMQWAGDSLKRVWSVYSEKERNEMTEKKVFYPELGTSATKMRLIMMALNLGNQDNKEKMFQNAPVGVEDAKQWDETVVMGLLEKHLDKRDWDFVQANWDMINELWPRLAKMHKEIAGFTPGKVEAVPFNVTLKDGSTIALRGGYFPLKEDPRASVKAEVREQLDSPLYTEQNPAWMATTKTGHTKARTGAQYSVSLEYSLVFRHLRDVIHDITFRPVIIDQRRLIGNEMLQDALRRNIQPEGFALLREWVGAAAGGNTVERNALEVWEKGVGWLRRSATVAALMLKPSVIIQNFANPFLFAHGVEGFGKKEALHAFFVRGVLDYQFKWMTNWKVAKEMQDFVFEKSRFMLDKKKNPDMSIGEVIGKGGVIGEFSGALMAWSDNMTAIPMWLEAYNKKLDQKATEEEAIKYADTLIDRTLGSGRKYDAAQIQRGGELARSMSMFYTFLNTEFNRWLNEVGMAKLDPSKRARLLGFVAGRLLFFVPVSALLSGHLPGEDDDDVSFWLKEVLGYPMNFFPGLREISTVAMSDALGIRSFGYRPSPATAAIEAGLATSRVGKSLLSGDADFEQFLQSTSKTAAYLVPYPDQLNSWFWNAYDYAANGMEPKPGDFYRRRPKNDR